jgi:hypothetical protein
VVEPKRKVVHPDSLCLNKKFHKFLCPGDTVFQFSKWLTFCAIQNSVKQTKSRRARLSSCSPLLCCCAHLLLPVVSHAMASAARCLWLLLLCCLYTRMPHAASPQTLRAKRLGCRALEATPSATALSTTSLGSFLAIANSSAAESLPHSSMATPPSLAKLLEPSPSSPAASVGL